MWIKIETGSPTATLLNIDQVVHVDIDEYGTGSWKVRLYFDSSHYYTYPSSFGSQSDAEQFVSSFAPYYDPA